MEYKGTKTTITLASITYGESNFNHRATAASYEEKDRRPTVNALIACYNIERRFCLLRNVNLYRWLAIIEAQILSPSY